MKQKLRIPAIVIATALLLLLAVHLSNRHTFQKLLTVTDGNRIMGGTETVAVLELTHLDSRTSFLIEDADKITEILALVDELAYFRIEFGGDLYTSGQNTYSIFPYAPDGTELLRDLLVSHNPRFSYLWPYETNNRYRMNNTAPLLDYLDELFSTQEPLSYAQLNERLDELFQ
jgi:hypothetical protein